MSDLLHLKLPISFNKPKPKKFPLSVIPSSSIVHPLNQPLVPSRKHCQHYGHLHPLSLDNAIQYGNLSPAFTLASFKFLEGVYDILHEHQEQFQDFLDWVPTVLHKHHPDLAAQLQLELDHNSGECLTTILPSTDMTIPATSCFAKERWLDQTSMDACLDAFDGLYNTNANIFIFTIDLSTLISSNDNTSEWSAFHNRTFDTKSLTDVIGVLPIRVEDCKGRKGCGCRKRGGCKKNEHCCECDDHCVCNQHNGCEHPDPCDCLPDHWAYFRLDLQRSAFFFGDSLNNDPPKARINRVKKFIAMAIQPPEDNIIDPDRRWPTKIHNMPKQPKDSGSCGVIVLNTIQHALDPLTPIWTPENNQEHRAHMLELASRRKSLARWSPSSSGLSSPFNTAGQFTPSSLSTSPPDTADRSTLPPRLASPMDTAEPPPPPSADKLPLASSFTPNLNNSSFTTDTTPSPCPLSTHKQNSSSSTSPDNATSTSTNDFTIPVDFNKDAASSSPTEPSMPVDTTSRTSPSDPAIPNHSIDATNNGTQPGSARSTFIHTFSSNLSNLPLDYNFTDTVFETLEHALQTIYAFANTHLFPIHRVRTHADPNQYDRPRIEILCSCFGTRDHVTRKNDKRRIYNGTVNTLRKQLKWEKTECPWRIYIVPDATIPKWRVTTYGTNGAYQHNHDVGTPSMCKHINRCPDINTLTTSRINTKTNEPPLKRIRLQPPIEDPPSSTLEDLFKYIRTACQDQPSVQSRIIQSTYDHVRGLLRTSNK